jgi:hypothetical protein
MSDPSNIVDLLILTTPPQQLPALRKEFAGTIPSQCVVISVMAGVSEKKLRHQLRLHPAQPVMVFGEDALWTLDAVHEAHSLSPDYGRQFVLNQTTKLKAEFLRKLKDVLPHYLSTRPFDLSERRVACEYVGKQLAQWLRHLERCISEGSQMQELLKHASTEMGVPQSHGSRRRSLLASSR